MDKKASFTMKQPCEAAKLRQQFKKNNSKNYVYALIGKVIFALMTVSLSLQAEFAEKLAEKKGAYAELKKVRDELRDLTVHTANYEELRDLAERDPRKEKEHGRE